MGLRPPYFLRVLVHTQRAVAAIAKAVCPPVARGHEEGQNQYKEGRQRQEKREEKKRGESECPPLYFFLQNQRKPIHVRVRGLEQIFKDASAQKDKTKTKKSQK